MNDTETVEKLSAIAASYIKSLGAEMNAAHEEARDGIVFPYHYGRAGEGGAPLPGDDGSILVRWDGSAVDMQPSTGGFELPALPAFPHGA